MIKNKTATLGNVVTTLSVSTQLKNVSITNAASFKGEVILPLSPDTPWPTYRVFLFEGELSNENLIQSWDFSSKDNSFSCELSSEHADVDLKKGTYIIGMGPVWDHKSANVISATCVSFNQQLSTYDAIQTSYKEENRLKLIVDFHAPQGVVKFNSLSRTDSESATKIILRKGKFISDIYKNYLKTFSITKDDETIVMEHEYALDELYNYGVFLYSYQRLVEGKEFVING
ncbi:MAG: hypothetical protein HRT58_15250 [Crocinitomicaceae bacterium]|nr:hypothetical protein [Flavobacteriales bacterium]NQZ37024.1 hypothetical protein [Crocinitomicaceae bacterium]